METMNISLPENLKEFVDSRVKAGGYSSVSEYVRDLVREDQKKQTQENLEVLLLKATRSGPGREFKKADWEALRRELAKRLAQPPGK
jgi:antitoxin ParD1/3/4